MRTVLIIDDEDAIVRFLVLALSRAGFRVDIAANGREGLEKLQSAPFDVVLTDIRMPLMDGNQMGRQIRKAVGTGTVLIAMTGTPEKAHRDLFDAIISKPFSVRALLDTIDCHTGTPPRRPCAHKTPLDTALPVGDRPNG